MEKKFIVYMHITPSNKRYIGITSNEYKRRWQNGYGYSSIQAVCKGKRKTAGGFSWEYCEVV